MSESVELCALRDGFWDIISSYDESQESIAIKEAANIQTGYAAVAVLSVSKMHVAYFNSLRGLPKPSYYEVRKSIKAERPTMRQQARPQRAPSASSTKGTSSNGSGNTKSSAKTEKKATNTPSFWESLIDSIYYLLTGKKSHSAANEQEAQSAPMPTPLKSLHEEQATDKDTSNDLDNLLEAHLKEEEKAPMADNKPVEDKEEEKTEGTPQTGRTEPVSNPAQPVAEKQAAPNPFRPAPQADTSTEAKPADNTTQSADMSMTAGSAALPKIGGGQMPNLAPQSEEDTAAISGFWQNIDENDYDSAKMQVQKSLDNAVERAKQLAWLPEYNMMRGTLQIASILFICGIGRKICSELGLPGGISNQAIGQALESLGLSEKKAFICALHVDRILMERNNHLMYLIGRAYGANILNDSESRIDLLSIFNAWENGTLERFFEVDNASKTAKLSKLPYLKPIAIFQTDIVSFTKQSNEKGDKWVKDVIHAHKRMTKTITSQHKGEFIQGTGDGVILIFTTPQAAMQAALQLQLMHQNFCHRVASRSFDLRIAISHGIPIQTQSGLHGPPIEELSLLHKHLKAGGLAVTEAIARAAEQHGFKFKVSDGVSLPVYEFTTYTRTPTVDTDDGSPAQSAAPVLPTTQQEGHP